MYKLYFNVACEHTNIHTYTHSRAQNARCFVYEFKYFVHANTMLNNYVRMYVYVYVCTYASVSVKEIIFIHSK